MTIMSYAGVNFGTGRTLFNEEELALDDAGNVDPLMTCITLESQSVLNPAWLASNVAQGRGDRSGVTLNTIRAALETPRQQLIFAVGPDRIVASPALDPTDPAGQRFLPCDARNGPIPEVIRLTEIVGDKSIFVHFRVRTWIRNTGNVLISNRWSITCDTDFQGMTTRTINGQAVIRADAIGLFGIHGADDFRHHLFIPCPHNFIRQNPVVVQSADGTTVTYTVVDRETCFALGATSVAVEVQGNATAGTETVIKNLPDTISAAWGLIAQGLNLDIKGIIGGVLKSAVPVNKANACICCYGTRALPKQVPVPVTTREALADLAVKIAIDRFGDAFVVSAYCTQGLDPARGPWCRGTVGIFPVYASVPQRSRQRAGLLQAEDGVITKGAPSLTGKRIDALHEDAGPVSKRMETSRGKEYARAIHAKQARGEGINPAHLHQLAAQIVAHDREFVEDRRRVLKDACDALSAFTGGHINAVHAAARGGQDAASFPGLDEVAEDLAKRDPHLFSSSEHPSDTLFSMLREGVPQRMSEDDAYRQAAAVLREHVEQSGTGGRRSLRRAAKRDEMLEDAPFYDPDQERNERGRWTGDGSTADIRSSDPAKPLDETTEAGRL